MGILENLSNHLLAYKTRHGLSINDLAADLKVGRTTIHNCLHKTWNPTLAPLTHLAQQMDIPLEELLLPPEQLRTQQEDARESLLLLKRLLEDME